MIRPLLAAARLLGAATIALAVGSCGTEPSADSLQGKWGGRNVALTVDADGAMLKLPCAVGTLPVPSGPDAEGRFTTAGEVHNHWGSTPVTVDGQIRFGQLALRVTLSGASEVHLLARGREGEFKDYACLH